MPTESDQRPAPGDKRAGSAGANAGGSPATQLGDGRNGPQNGHDRNGVPLARRRRVVISIFLLLIVAGAAYWYWNTHLRGFASTNDAYIEADRVAISTKILGRLAVLTVGEGDTVTAGQVLLRLDDKDLVAQREQASAALTLAQEGIALAKVNVTRAQDDYARAETQIKDAVITQEQFDHARHALEGARAELGIALARVGGARAQVDVVQAQIDNCVVTAPVNGKVAKRWALRGDVVQPGQPVLSIYDRGAFWVTANLEETNLHAVRLGQAVEIGVDSYPGRTFAGQVIEIGGATAAQFSLIPPNNASGNFTKVTQRVPVKISITEQRRSGDQPALLLPGMSVEVHIKVR
jgi:membrane fusion protein, multidrug efflux system